MPIQVPEYDTQIMIESFLDTVADPNASEEGLREALDELLEYVQGNAIYYTMVVLCRELIHELLPRHGFTGGNDLITAVDSKNTLHEPIYPVVADLIRWCENEAKQLNVDLDLFYEDLYNDNDLYEDEDI